MTETIRTLLADDHPLFREGVIRSLDRNVGFEVVGEADNGMEAVRLARSLQPDVALLDIRMNGGGLAAAELISTWCPDTRVVLLTISEDQEDLMKAMKIGASAYVLKGIAGEELVEIIRGAVAGRTYVSPGLAADMLRVFSSSPNPLDALTIRERQILELLSEGMTNQEIADHLTLSVKTVKHHMTHVLNKLQARNRTEAALLLQGRLKYRKT